MNKFFKNSFHDGVDRDTAINKYDNSHVFDAENVRIISDDALSNGAITSIRGTVPKATISAVAGSQIVGSCIIRDYAVLCVYDSNGGSIYKFKDSGSASPVSGELTLLYANSDLNFQIDTPIYMEGRYESEAVQKIYFSDGLTFFRHLNIASPTLATIEVGSMDIVSNITFGEISGAITEGGQLKAGKIQYSYQLYSVYGSESIFSPTGSLYSIANTLDGVKSSIYVNGLVSGTIVDKSMKVSITIVPAYNFNRLRLVAIEYESVNQTPSIRIVGEYDITGATILEVMDSGSSIGTLTLEEFRFITNNFYPKTIASKDNILFAGNIDERYFDITDAEFDARAFRFKLTAGTLQSGSLESNILMNPGGSSPVSKQIFYDGTDNKIYTDVVYNPDPVYSIVIDSDHDCYNSFNNLSNDEISSHQYIYDPVNKKIGGIGANISYEFITHQTLIDEGSTGLQGSYPKITSEVFDNTNLVNDLAEYTGYQRDEIYRFGIVLFDLNGRPSFAKWIGDIRFPNNHQLPFITYSSPNTYANNLGIKFTVSFPTAVANKVSGYQIVRLDREDKDKTVKSSGVAATMIKTNYLTWNGNNKLHSASTMPTYGDCSAGKIRNIRWSTSGSNSGDIILNSTSANTLDWKHWEYVSPNISFNKKLEFDSNDFSEIVGAVDTNINSLHIQGTGSPIQTVCDKLKNFLPASTMVANREPILNINTFSQTSYEASDFILDNSVAYFNQCSNMYSSGLRYGARGSFSILSYKDDFALAAGPLWIHWGDLTSTGYGWLMQYIRSNKNLAIYNGVTYVSRLQNTYYQTSKFVSKYQPTVEVFSGDTYIDMFFYMRSFDDASGRAQATMIFPVESTINTKLRTDKIQQYLSWSVAPIGEGIRYRIQETEIRGVEIYNINYPTEIGDLYRYNSTYSMIDKSKSFTLRPQDLSSVNIYDTRVYASNLKISGEYTDSWLKFKFNEYKDIDSQFGSLTRLLNVNNKLMFFQPDGVGVLSVNDRALVQSPTSYSMTLGTGGVLERFDYLTFDSGASNQEDIVKSNKTFYYVDRVRKKINKYEGTDTPISVIKGVNSLLKALDFDKVICGFDPNYLDVIFSVDNLTIVFNELTNNFTSGQLFNPNGFLSIGMNLYSIKDTANTTALTIDSIINVDYNNLGDFILVNDGQSGNTLFKHNVGTTGLFYDDVVSNSIVEVIVHPEDNNICQFQCIDLRMDITDGAGVEKYTNTKYDGYIIPIFDTIKLVRFANSYMSKEFKVLFYHPNHILQSDEVFIKKIANAWRIQLPIMTSIVPPTAEVGVIGHPSRFVDTHLKVKLTFDSSTTNRWKLHDIITYYNTVKV